jgi:hypothetical protein
MQGFLKPYQVAQIKKKYPPGTRIELDGMDGERDVVRQIKSTTISHFILSRIAQSRLYEA